MKSAWDLYKDTTRKKLGKKQENQRADLDYTPEKCCHRADKMQQNILQNWKKETMKQELKAEV